MKIRIPLTDTIIELQPLKLMVTYLALFSGRTQAAQGTCQTPTGNYLDSCRIESINFYQSVDSNVPRACEFRGSCATMLEGLKPKDNVIYYPTNLELTLSNDNGTLTYNGESLSSQQAKNNPEFNCQKPNGSYRKTCDVDVEKYTSTDPNLKDTLLCRATALCDTVKGFFRSRLVYFNLKKDGDLVEKIENCDGYLVLNQQDDRCNNKPFNEIKEIATREGQAIVRF